MSLRYPISIIGVWLIGLTHWGGEVCAHKRDIIDNRSQYYELVDSADYRLRREEWSKAEEYLVKALKCEPANPGNTLLFSNLGVAQIEQGKYMEAQKSLEIALTRAPGSSVILTHLTRVLLAQGKPLEAMEQLDKILRVDSLNEWALQTRGLLRLQRKVVKEEAERFEDFRQLSKNYPKNPWGWFGLAVEEDENGGHDAEKLYHQAYNIEHSSEIGFRLGMYLLKEDKISEAMKILRETLREHPQDGNLYAAMGWAHKKNYQTEEYEADLKLAREYGASPEIVSWIEQQ